MVAPSTSQCQRRHAFTSTVFLQLSLTSLLGCYLWHIPAAVSALDGNTFDVVSFGAVGDGNTDSTQAFLKAWEAACHSTGSATMTVPAGKIFLVAPATFSGPCTASPLHVQVNGSIVAPASISAWKGTDYRAWLWFKSVNRLVIYGQGTIDGRGSVWWAQSCKINPENPCKDAPMALKLEGCSNMILSGLTITNSPMFHVFISSDNVLVSNLHISSPGDSPNTDGIHVQSAVNVSINNCVIKAGDDCVSISTGTFNINVTEITCGSGHGISIGSLGKGDSDATVEKIYVNNVNLANTTNGVRIKTWQGGSGYARNIIFEEITFDNVNNPILIDQYYCDARKPCRNQTSAVKVSQVSYIGINGSSADEVAIKLACSQSVACSGLIFNNVNLWKTIKGAPASSYCFNAQTRSMGTVQPALSCSS